MCRKLLLFFLMSLFLFPLVTAQATRDNTDLVLRDGSRIEIYYLNPLAATVRLNEINTIAYENELINLGHNKLKWNLKFDRTTTPFLDEIKIDISGVKSFTRNTVYTKTYIIDFSDAVSQGFSVNISKVGDVATVTIGNLSRFTDLVIIDPTILDTTDTSFSNYGNVLARDSAGSIWIVQEALTSSSNMDIYVHKSTDNGVSFSTFNLTNTSDFNESLPRIDTNATDALIIVYNKQFGAGATSEVFLTTCSTGGCDASSEFLSDINVSQCGATVRCANNNLDVGVNDYSHVTYGKDDTNLVYRQNTGYVGTVGSWGSEEININVGASSILNRVSTGVTVSKTGGKKLAWVNANGSQVIVVDYNGTSWQGPLTIQITGVSTPPSVFSGYDNNYYVTYARDYPPFLTVLTQCPVDTNCSNSANWTSDINVSTNADNSFVSIMQSSDLNLHIFTSASYSSADANIHHYVRLPNGTITSTQDANLLFNDSNRTYNPLLRNRDYYGSVNPTVGPSTNLFLDYVFLTTSSSTGNPSTQVYDFNHLDANGLQADFSSNQIQPLIISPFQSAIYDFNSTSAQAGFVIRDYNWFVDGTQVKSSLASQDYNLTRTFTTIKDYNISLIIKSTLGGLVSQKDLNLTLGALPSITFTDANATTSISTSPISNIGNIAMRCTTGNATLDLNYKIQLNDVNVTNQLLDDNYTLHLTSQPFTDGTNTIVYYCISSDSIAVKTKTINFFNKNFYLVFDHTGAVVPNSGEYVGGDVNSAFVYSFDSNTVLNLITSNAVSWFASGDSNSAIQLRLGYDDVTFPFTTRNFHLSVLDTNSVPVCYSRLQTFYENIFYSSVERDIILKNSNTLCYHFAGKTRASYGDSLSMRAFLVPQSYNLYLVESGVKSLLSVVEGSSSGTINIDALILKKDFAQQLIITSEGVTIAKNCGGPGNDCNTWAIRYKNTGSNNSNVVLTIYNESAAQFSHTETDSPNNFTVTFSSSDLNFDATLLSLTAVATRINGETKTFTVYFTPQGQVGFIHPLVALVLSFIIFIGGITLVSMRLVFGWFGAAIVIIALALLSFSVGAWYIVFMQAVMLIMLAYIGTSTYKQTLGAV